MKRVEEDSPDVAGIIDAPVEAEDKDLESKLPTESLLRTWRICWPRLIGLTALAFAPVDAHQCADAILHQRSGPCTIQVFFTAQVP